MALPCYMAMTSAEFLSADILPQHSAWMACHFSCFGSGLSNLPGELPRGSMVILNDHTPLCGHQPEAIVQELEALHQRLQPSCFLLDFERPGSEEAAQLARCLVGALPCPVGVSHLYAQELDCPVFLPPPPLPTPLEAYLSPWKGREIWLEISTEAAIVTVTAEGATVQQDVPVVLDDPVFLSDKLACRYHITLQEHTARFYMQRDLELYKQTAEHFGAARLVGLYQDFN